MVGGVSPGKGGMEKKIFQQQTNIKQCDFPFVDQTSYAGSYIQDPPTLACQSLTM